MEIELPLLLMHEKELGKRSSACEKMKDSWLLEFASLINCIFKIIIQQFPAFLIWAKCCGWSAAGFCFYETEQPSPTIAVPIWCLLHPEVSSGEGNIYHWCMSAWTCEGGLGPGRRLGFGGCNYHWTCPFLCPITSLFHSSLPPFCHLCSFTCYPKDQAICHCQQRPDHILYSSSVTGGQDWVVSI